MLMIMAMLLCARTADPPVVIVDHDNIEITESCRVRVAHSPIIDAEGNGVLHITASDISVEFANDSPPLHGANTDKLPDSFAGKGIVITGCGVTLSGARVSGYKVGIHAKNAERLRIHHVDVSNNFHQRLKSTPQAEDASDWLWPHANDNNEWITNYGAGLCVEDSKSVTLHDIRARKTQNGIILDAVNDSKVYDCDCSFLSGWGLAMWRSNRNVISRNAFDFCVRGYSHGVYNRGQDSAGILMFEQCCENVIAENSCTHGGDGFFGFAGKEALGEVNVREDLEWYEQRGNGWNTIIANDLSHAAAHGLELTFSHFNYVCENVIRGNAICGIWGGYSQAMIVDGNQFANNGEGAYGLERGGVNIEHGDHNLLSRNVFEGDACGVHLWWDDDRELLALPWAQANTPAEPANFIWENSFLNLPLAIQLRSCKATSIADNSYDNVTRLIEADPLSDANVAKEKSMVLPPPKARPAIEGVNRPTSARAALAGREHIIMTEWGPWNHEEPLLQYVQRFDHADEYRVLGRVDKLSAERAHATGSVFVDIEGDRIFVRPRASDALTPYELSVNAGDAQPLTARGLLTGGSWTVRTFASPCDPREDVERWRAGVDQPGTHTLTCDPLDLPFGSGGMTEARHLPGVLPRDHFGCIAARTLTFPPGKWRITATSDDGIRVWLDEQLVIDDWTWHAPKKHTHEFDVPEARETRMRVEYFELDGHAVLRLEIAPNK